MKKVFQAKDGSEHDTAKNARQRDEVVDAVANLNEAVVKLERAMVNKVVTADGKTLHIGMSQDFWVIRDHSGLSCFPRIEKVWLWIGHMEVDVAENGEMWLREFSQPPGGGRYVSYRVSELYSDERKARQACAKISKQRMQEITEEYTKLMEAIEKGD